MLDAFKAQATLHDSRVLLTVKLNLSLNLRVQDQRTNLFEHWHALILLDVTCRNGMNDHFTSDVLNAWLKARACDLWNLDEVIAFTVIGNVYIVPCAVERYWHTGIFTFFESGRCDHDVSVQTLWLSCLAVCWSRATVDQVEIK